MSRGGTNKVRKNKLGRIDSHHGGGKILRMESRHIEKSFRSEQVCSLDRFCDGRHGTIVDLTTDTELQGRLMGMGLFIGTRFQLLRSGTMTSRIPFQLAIGETRIAIDYEIADKILVES